MSSGGHYLQRSCRSFSPFFFFNDSATTEIYTLSLHDALPIFGSCAAPESASGASAFLGQTKAAWSRNRSEEHMSELQSRQYLVCRLLLEKKKNRTNTNAHERTSSTPCPSHQATSAPTRPTRLV